jgi:hypothetical protein
MAGEASYSNCLTAAHMRANFPTEPINEISRISHRYDEAASDAYARERKLAAGCSRHP